MVYLDYREYAKNKEVIRDKVREDMVRIFNERELSINALAQEVGVYYQTLLSFMEGKTDTSYHTVSKVYKWLYNNNNISKGEQD